MAITPDGTRAYVVNQLVTNQGNSTVPVIDTMTNTIVATIPVGLDPFAIAITPDGTRAYVPNQQDFILSVIDTTTNTVVTTVPVSGTGGVAITPDGTRAYVTSPGGGTVSVIDTASNTVAATILLGANQNPFGVAITPDGTRAYVTINFLNIVSVIDTATNTVVATIPVGVGPIGIAITPDGTRAYVTNDVSNSSRSSTPRATPWLKPFRLECALLRWPSLLRPKPRPVKSSANMMGSLRFGPPAGPFKNQGQCVSFVEHH